MCGPMLKKVFPHLSSECSLLRSVWGDYWPCGFRHRVGWVEKSVLSLLVFRRAVSLSTWLRDLLVRDDDGRSIFTEMMTIIWSILLVVFVFYPFWGRGWLAVIVLGYLIWGAINYPLCIIFIDRHKSRWEPQSYNRLLILLFVNYLQMIAGFAYLYLYTAKVVRNECNNVITSGLDALYFSLVTITTLGFGDMKPLGSLAEFWVITEVLFGLVFLVLVVATVIALSTRQ